MATIKTMCWINPFRQNREILQNSNGKGSAPIENALAKPIPPGTAKICRFSESKNISDREVYETMKLSPGLIFAFWGEMWRRFSRPLNVAEPVISVFLVIVLSPLALLIDVLDVVTYPLRKLYAYCKAQRDRGVE